MNTVKKDLTKKELSHQSLKCEKEKNNFFVVFKQCEEDELF